jgi:excisionase family DNA binding protein
VFKRIPGADPCSDGDTGRSQSHRFTRITTLYCGPALGGKLGATDDRTADVRFLTVAEVAEIMRVSKMTVYLVHSGELPAVRFGRSYRVPETAVTDALQPVADVG